MTRKPVFWILLSALAVLGASFALRYYGEAFPLLNVNVEMDRGRALSEADALARAAGWGPAGFRQAASFRQTDPEVQTYVELEGGGAEAFAELVQVGPYRPYVWEVRHFAEGSVAETWLRFTPEGRPFGFREILPEDEARPNLDATAARLLAEQEARTRWSVEPLSYRPIEASQETRPGGRVDHTFVYELDQPDLGDAAVRLRLVVAGDALSELTHFVFVPDAFLRRYQELRSANDAVALLSNLVFLVLFLGVGCGVGSFVLLRSGWIVWRPAALWAFAIAVLVALGTLNQLPLSWMVYDTAVSRSIFLLQQVGVAVSIVVLGTPLLALVFLAAESLTRRAFPRQPQQWRLWSREAARSDAVLGRTVGGYLWAGIDLGFVVGFYVLASRLPGWWIPSEAIVDPDLLSTPFPWLMAVSLSAFAGFWEESLFRAVPIAGAKLLGDRFGGTRAWIVTAVVVQALVFAAAHANYPQQPSYARVAELFLPALAWGVIYLFFGLMPVILIHFLHNFTFFSVFLFNASGPGLWLDQTISLLLMLTPLAVVMILRLRGGRLRELPDELRNAGWRPAAMGPEEPPVAPAGEPEHPLDVDRPMLVAITRPRVLAAAGAIGALLLVLLGNPAGDAPPLSATRAEALAAARDALVSEGVSPGDWEELAAVDGTPEASGRFVWETSGEDAYRSLLGTYLTPPRWQVRFARFTGPVEERAEEWSVDVGPEGNVRRVVHELPEGRPAPALDEAAARALALARAQQEVGASGRAREISAEVRQRPARRDWLFTYVVDNGLRLDQGELRVEVEVAGDQAVSARRLVHIPEAWEREERGRATRELIVRLGSAGILGLILLATAVTAVVVWSRGRFNARVFATVALSVAALQTANALNGYPATLAGFSTTQPLRTQTLTFAITLLLSGLIGAGGLGLLAGLAHSWLWRPITTSMKRPAAAGVAVALTALGVAAAARAIRRSATGPEWPGYADADAYVPTLSSVLASATSFIALTTVLLLVVAALHRFSGSSARRKSDLRVGVFFLSLLLSGVGIEIRAGMAEAMLEWGIRGGLVALGIGLLHPLARRYHPAVVPFIAATLLAVSSVEVALARPYPGASIGGVLGVLALVAGATVWARALARDSQQRSAD